MPFVNTAHRRHIAVITTVGDANMLQAERLSQRRIQSYPSGIGQIDFRPGMRGIPSDHFLQFGVGRRRAFRNEVAGNISRRKPSLAHHAQQEVREVLANSRARESES